MNKREIYELLQQKEIFCEITEHSAVYTMEEAAALNLPCPQAEAKNLFLRDNRKENYYLLTVKGEKRVNLNAFRKKHGTRALTFAAAEELERFLGLIPGAVTPLGVLNDADSVVRIFLDRDFLQGDGRIGVHPNDNTATVLLKTEDLIRLLREAGKEVILTEFEES